MDKELLRNAYSPENFREQGHLIIEQLAHYLDTSLNNPSEKVIHYRPPEDELAFWNGFFEKGDPELFTDELISRTIRLHHPNYMGHQISPVAPVTALTSMISALLNNGMGVYEMGAGPTAIEHVVIAMLCQSFGYPKEAGGFLTSGGTLANLTALLSARKQVAKNNVWEGGTQNRLAIMVSEESHYCIDRAAKIMGLGEEGIIKIPADENFAIQCGLLEEYYDNALRKGLEVFAIIGSAPSTATGIYDDLEALGEFAANKKIWFHVDAAHGGAAIFSAKYKALLKGVQYSDSLVLDGHKMMMMPAITTALLFKNSRHSHETFSQKAAYLLQETKEEDWYNLAKRTFECTKYMMCLHWYILLKNYGTAFFDQFVNTLYDLGKELGQMIQQDPQFELAVVPKSNIVCFRFIGQDAPEQMRNEINSKIRRQLLEEGEYYIVHTKLRGSYYLRSTLMNPFTTSEQLKGLMHAIKEKGAQLISESISGK